jgi:dTDP-4-amino-4,6-dideoxygalactose transaminase
MSVGLPKVTVPFVRPHQLGTEMEGIAAALAAMRLAGDNAFSKKCHRALEQILGVHGALLTPSGTAALELAAILADIGPGDEVILPSYTFSSTANAVALRGATPVFVDIRPDTLNIDEQAVKQAITTRTRAIFVVHYAGVPCEMETISHIAGENGLLVLEDAAQAFLSAYRGRYAGTLGDMAAFSFHETKNIQCGEGGAFVTNRADLLDRAEIVREKGTNRSAFFRGEVDKYTWVDIGSSLLPNELTAAFLSTQLDGAAALTADRLAIWNQYHLAFAPLEEVGLLRRPVIPADCQHNAHIYYLLLPSLDKRTSFIKEMRLRGIQTTFHYVPLHNAPAGLKYGRAEGTLAVTTDIADRLVRLPLWPGMGERVEDVIQAIFAVLGDKR